MSRIIIYPYKVGSRSAAALAKDLESKGNTVLKVYPDRNYKPRARDFIVNWGNGADPEWHIGQAKSIMNFPKAVNRAGNKLTAFRSMEEHVAILKFTESKVRAQDWVNNGDIVVVRAQLRGHSGAGISLVGSSIENGDYTGIVPDAPLYTQYYKKAREYRVHVFNGEVILWQQKMLQSDFPKDKVNYQVRNHQFGWIFATGAGAALPCNGILSSSINAVAALGLQFGAVDIAYNIYHDTWKVLEVNTAPGLEGRTIEIYSDAIVRARG